MRWALASLIMLYLFAISTTRHFSPSIRKKSDVTAFPNAWLSYRRHV